jgi:hypothetical protein
MAQPNWFVINVNGHVNFSIGIDYSTHILDLLRLWPYYFTLKFDRFEAATKFKSIYLLNSILAFIPQQVIIPPLRFVNYFN